MDINLEGALIAAVGDGTVLYWLVKGLATWLVCVLLIQLIPERYIRYFMPKAMAYIVVTLLVAFSVMLAINNMDPIEFFQAFADGWKN